MTLYMYPCIWVHRQLLSFMSLAVGLAAFYCHVFLYDFYIVQNHVLVSGLKKTMALTLRELAAQKCEDLKIAREKAANKENITPAVDRPRVTPTSTPIGTFLQKQRTPALVSI